MQDITEIEKVLGPHFEALIHQTQMDAWYAVAVAGAILLACCSGAWLLRKTEDPEIAWVLCGCVAVFALIVGIVGARGIFWPELVLLQSIL